MCSCRKGCGVDDEDVRYLGVQFDIFCIKDLISVRLIVADCGESGGGFCGDVQLDIVNITVKLQAVVADNISKWEHVEDEEEWIKH